MIIYIYLYIYIFIYYIYNYIYIYVHKISINPWLKLSFSFNGFVKNPSPGFESPALGALGR